MRLNRGVGTSFVGMPSSSAEAAVYSAERLQKRNPNIFPPRTFHSFRLACDGIRHGSHVLLSLLDMLLRDAIGRGNLAFRNRLGRAPASHPERQRDQQQQNDQRGPLGLLEPPIEGE